METIPPGGEADSPNSADPLFQLQRLIPHLGDDELDIDAIDGEFYWRCCRRDLWDGIEELRALLQQARTHRREDGLLSEQGQVVLDGLDRLVNQFESEDPNIERHLFHAGWVKLREGRVGEYG